MRAALFFFISMIVITALFVRVSQASDAGALASVPTDAGVAFDAAAVTAAAAPIFAPVLATPDDAGEFVSSLVTATKDGQWRMVSALAILAVVWFARKYGSKKVPWFATKWGGVTLALSMGILAQFVTDLSGEKALSWTFVINGLVQGALASGAWSMIKGTHKAPATPAAPAVEPPPVVATPDA